MIAPKFLYRSVVAAVALILPTAIWSAGARQHLNAPGQGEIIPGLGTLIGPVGSTSPSSAGNVVTEIPSLANTGIHNEPSISVDPNNPLHLVVASNDAQIFKSGSQLLYRFITMYRTSFDGGQSWINGFPKMGGFDFTGDPTVAFDSRGNVYIAAIVAHITWTGIADLSVAVFKSIDGGINFNQFSLVAAGSGANATSSYLDKPWMTIDRSLTSPFRDRIYVEWQRGSFKAGAFTGLTVELAWSADGAKTWSSPRVLGAVPDIMFTTTPATAPDGTVYASFARFQSSPLHDDYLITRSNDGGVTWSAPSIIVDIAVGDVFPVNPVGAPTLNGVSYRVFTSTSHQLTVGPDGTLYFAWFDNRNGAVPATNTDIFMVASHNGGLTWGNAMTVDTGPGDQFFLDIQISPGGVLNIAYYDDGYDAAGVKLGVTLARSTNGGATWSRTAVHTGLSDPSLERWYLRPTDDPSGQSIFIGDYIGLAVDSNGRAHVVWTDLRYDVDPGLQVGPKTKGENIVYGSVVP